VGAGFPSRHQRNAFARRSCSNQKEIERDDDSKKNRRALAARGYSAAAAGDRLSDSPMRRSEPFAIGVVAAPGAAACIDKILFTINDIDEGFFGLSDFTDQRVNLWVGPADQCGTDAQ
jgi:hypothetical protein